ncbi:MAG: ATP-binding protein [Myxococcota bacterium]
MCTLSTVVIAWAAVYGYVGLYYILLYLRRPSEREHLSFGLIGAGMCLFSAARGALLQATSVEEAVMPSRLTWVGLLVAIAFFVDFCHALAGRESRWRRAAFVFGGVGVILALLGLIEHATFSRDPSEWGLPSAPDYNDLHLTPVGVGVLLGAMLFAVVAVSRLWPAATRDRDVRTVLVATAIAVAAGGHDVVVRLGMLQSYYLLEHAAIGVIVVMSYLLLGRYVRTYQAIRERTEELDHSYHELRRTQERLVRKEQLAAVGELSAVIAHEVRNPLAIIKNAVSGLRRPSLSAEDRRTLLGILAEEAARLARLVEDLVAYARPMVPQDQPVHLDELVWGALDLARSGNPHATDVAVTVELAAAPEMAYGDPALLRQALMNLIDNAIQAMPSGGELTIRARPTLLEERHALAIEIRDSGEGMDTLVREKARNPFFTTRPAGTGLGLAIVERVVRNHGGVLTIDSRHGVGTTVTVTLPHPATQDERSGVPLPGSLSDSAAGST